VQTQTGFIFMRPPGMSGSWKGAQDIGRRCSRVSGLLIELKEKHAELFDAVISDYKGTAETLRWKSQQSGFHLFC